jgi:nicotinate-nucleotide adenylyltransferase
MNKDGVRIGIMGGTFNPIHNGHLVAAEICRINFNLDEIHFVTSGHPAHKSSEYLATKEDRYNMTVLATEKNSFFTTSRIEIDRGGESYSIDTLEEYKRRYPKEGSIYFITGGDAIKQLDTWKSVDRLVKLCSFIAVTRPEYDNQTFFKIIETFKNTLGANILSIEIPPLRVSSTEIRKRIREGKTIENLVPQAVERYIYGKKLYR